MPMSLPIQQGKEHWRLNFGCFYFLYTQIFDMRLWIWASKKSLDICFDGQCLIQFPRVTSEYLHLLFLTLIRETNETQP